MFVLLRGYNFIICCDIELKLCTKFAHIPLYMRACLITLHSNFEIFQKGHPAVEFMLDRRIFER